jgi:hypothetical protein
MDSHLSSGFPFLVEVNVLLGSDLKTEYFGVINSEKVGTSLTMLNNSDGTM